MKNGWLDEENRAYIVYAVENIMENFTSESKEAELQEVKDFALNYNNTNYNDQSGTDRRYINQINQWESGRNSQTVDKGEDSIDRIDVIDNAPSTMNHYYQQEIRHDMYGSGWEEKGVKCQTFGHCVQKLDAL